MSINEERTISTIEKAKEDPNAYDMGIHSNPDARAWARFFKATCDSLGKVCDESVMIGWFANAMMAMHDHLLRDGQAMATFMQIAEQCSNDNLSRDSGEWLNIANAAIRISEHAQEMAAKSFSSEKGTRIPSDPRN